MKTKILCALLASGACLCRMAVAEAKAPQTIAELQAEMDKILRETGTPGAAVALVSRDGVEGVAGWGLAGVGT